MENIFNTILQQYGIYGVLIILVLVLGYMIYGDRKNNWGSKIDQLSTKIDCTNDKMSILEEKLGARIEIIEEKMDKIPANTREYEKNEAKKSTLDIMSKGWGGKLSKILQYHCKFIKCNHIFLGSLHNGTVDIRGLHYCKFDILIDEFLDPLHIHVNDVDFQQLYKDENILAYGDIPYTLLHMDAIVLDVDDDENTLLELSDTIYRRCKGRGVRSIGLAGIHDVSGEIIGFIGCISYEDEKMDINELKSCVHEIENIYELA